MSGTRHRYLVAYDIRDPKRLREIHKTLKGFGEPLQYSVFLCDLDPQEHVSMRSMIRAVILHSEDSVVIINLGLARTRGTDCIQFMGAKLHELPTSGPVIL